MKKRIVKTLNKGKSSEIINRRKVASKHHHQNDKSREEKKNRARGFKPSSQRARGGKIKRMRRDNVSI